MRKLILLAVLFTIIVKVNAQEAQNIADLDFLYKAIQELPSYKDQLKNDKNYQQLYESLRKDLNTADDFEVFKKLSGLILPIRDNHLSFYRKPDSNFRFVPIHSQTDLQSLEKKYSNAPKDSIEGLYHGGESKYIVYQAQKNVYELLSLADGNLRAILYQNGYGSYDVVQFLKYPYSYTLDRGIKLENNILVGMGYYKGSGKNFYSIIERKKKYEYKNLDDQVGYLSLGTFGSSDQTIKEATAFFNEVKPNITVKHLIVDVRNNYGGGYKNSRQFITFLHNFPGKVYILQNGFTVSNAEQFIINLKGKENVTTLGETTKGKITYGNNYGKTIALPSGRFLFYPTDMGGSKKELAFEGIGVKPDVVLTFNEDWIAQTLKYIKANE